MGSVTLVLEIAAIVILASAWGLTGVAIAVLVVAGGAHLLGLVVCGAWGALRRRLRASLGTIVATAVTVGLGLVATRLSVSVFPQQSGHLPVAMFSGIVVFVILVFLSRAYLTTTFQEMRRSQVLGSSLETDG